MIKESINIVYTFITNLLSYTLVPLAGIVAVAWIGWESLEWLVGRGFDTRSVWLLFASWVCYIALTYGEIIVYFTKKLYYGIMNVYGRKQGQKQRK